MRIFFVGMLTLLISMSAGDVWCQEVEPGSLTEAADETVETGVSTTDVMDTLGIGTKGYGSPVESDRVAPGEIIGNRSGYFHPFLSVGGFYTDNLFQTDDNEKSDNVAIITPGIWLSLPATRQKLIEVNTRNTVPGGLALSRFRTETTRRFQGYALYRADIREHDKYTDENRTDHRAEASFKVSLRGGLSLEVFDVYEIDHDPYGTGGTPNRELDKFDSNLFNAILAYQMTPKTLFRLDYGNYYLDYDKDRNSYRNRTDDSISAYMFYNLTPKTAMFLQFEYIEVDYDKDINSDNDVVNYYIGAQMRTSKKLRGRVKVGYGHKDFDDSAYNDRDEWLAEARLDYFFTPKTSIYLRGTRRVLESDSLGSNSILSYRTQLGYRQRFTAKLRGEMAVYYTDNEYKDSPAATPKRDDEEYGFIAAVGFTPIRWLNISAGYEYEERDSNIDDNDYTSNTVFLRLTTAL